MEFSQHEELMVVEACQAQLLEPVQLLDVQLTMVGGGIADVTLS